ncbi:hypothetical protein CHS0354_004903 [Potamilus streckersoni]|uniref:Uncharacterized protein n=1 Tax=Potamilus streckersoni TaxID=2493646 RepID=A0AAE0TJ19_9BIVA|nr:hypothetical protein CHS0354_004903 [Potamilus streckersoni]
MSTPVRIYEGYVKSNKSVVSVLKQRSREEVVSPSEMQMTSNDWISCSSAETILSYLNEERAREKENMLQLNKKLGEQVGRLHIMESEELFVQIITNIEEFAELFRTLLGGERPEIERLKDKIKTIEVERSRVSENLVKLNVEKDELVGTVKLLKQTVEKTSNDVLLLREENQKLKVECAMLTEKRQVQERRVISLQEELQYARETINTKDNEIGTIIGGKSGISIVVSMERSLKDATASIQKKYDEKLKKIKLSYETRMAEELNAWPGRLREAQSDEVDSIFREVDGCREEIKCLKEQLEGQSMYIQSLKSSHEEYKQWSEKRLGEFKANLNFMSSCLRKYILTNFSLKLEIDEYRIELERLETRRSGWTRRLPGTQSFLATKTRIEPSLSARASINISMPLVPENQQDIVDTSY